MALTKETTSSIVSKYGAKEKDTGNVKVQIALLTERIKQLTEHTKTFKKEQITLPKSSPDYLAKCAFEEIRKELDHWNSENH